MGINGLLPVLKSVTQHHVHVSTYAGKKVAIDAYGWLHRGAHQDPRGVAHKTDVAFAMVVDYCVVDVEVRHQRHADAGRVSHPRLAARRHEVFFGERA